MAEHFIKNSEIEKSSSGEMYFVQEMAEYFVKKNAWNLKFLERWLRNLENLKESNSVKDRYFTIPKKDAVCENSNGVMTLGKIYHNESI